LLYEDFILRIVADGPQFTVLARSRRGQANHSLHLDGLEVSRSPEPIAGTEATDRLEQEGAGRDLLPRGGVAATDLGETGARLFSAVFAGPVRELFDQTVGELAGKPGRGLRIRVRLDPREVRIRRLYDLPWELLFCSSTGVFLSLDRCTPVVRSLDTLKPGRPLPLATPLRVAIAMANPAGTEPLDLAEERRRIEGVFRDHGGIAVRFLESANRKSLRRLLREESFHVVHFMGHGRFDEVPGSGALLLEAPGGGADPLAGDTFASFFLGREHPLLVILNACRTAQSSSRPDANPFAGVASALVLGGMPAVLAMRSSIADSAAVEVADELYRWLALGDPVEAAVSEVRLALSAAGSGARDWANPALFLGQEAIGALLVPGVESAPAPVATPVPAEAGAVPREPVAGPGVTHYVVHNADKVDGQVNMQGNRVIYVNGK
jgi:hypothetical protein